MYKRLGPVMVAALVSLFFGLSGPASAQQTVTSAAISGRVLDSSGASISGATLSAIHVETNQKLTVTSDHDGRYRFPQLPVGNYKLSVEVEGFARWIRIITVGVGQALDLPIRLDVGGVSANVDVLSDVPLLETVRTQVTETVSPTEINTLPLNTRNYLDLALLIPGVSPTNTGSNQRFAETSAIPGQGISIAGQRNLYNSFIVDGLSANDDAADLTGSYYSEEVVSQFQVITSGGIAEFGRASGGFVNIVTKSGTNDWRGSLYGFGRNQRFDARNPVSPAKDSLTQAQYGATFAGPIKRDRTFLFSNFEQTRRNYSAVITINPVAVSAINDKLESVGYQGPNLETGIVPADFKTTNVFLRLDHHLNNLNELNARYSLYHIAAQNSRTVGGLNSVSRGSGLRDTDQTVAVSNLTALSPRSLNEFRFQYTNSRLDAPINDVIGPSVAIAGVANFGAAASSPTTRDINLFEVVDNISFQQGHHSLKVGADFLYNRVNIIFPGAVHGVFNFRSLDNFLTGNYDTFQQAFGESEQFQSNPNVGAFIQDEWRVTQNLTFNFGLRYDVQFLPDPIETDANNLAPRLGVAWSPGDGKTVIRGSAGLYYDRIPLRATSNALQRDGSKYVVVQFSPNLTGAPIFPNLLPVKPTTLITKPNITRIDPNIDTSYSEQASIQVDRQLPKQFQFSAGYIHLRGLHIIASRNLNVPTVPAAAGISNLGRPDSNWGNISVFEGAGISRYNGMVVSLSKRTSDWASLRLSYTLSKAIDDAGNFFFSTPQNSFDLRDDLGPSDNDQRHRLVISGSIQTPAKSKRLRLLHGFLASYIFTYASPPPFNILLGNDRNFDTNNNDRPVGVVRNSARAFSFASLDLRLSRRFKVNDEVSLDVLAEGFNLMNHANLSVPNNVFGPGVNPLVNFRQPTQAFDPRQFQFGVKLTF